jgi:hypothetical protein
MAISLPLTVLSCWTPPYDPAISASVNFEKKLENVARIGPTAYQGLDTGSDYFVPSYAAAPTDGFWVHRSSVVNLSIRYVNPASGQAQAGSVFYQSPDYFGDLNAVASLSPTTADSLGSDIGKGIILLGSGITYVNASPSESILGIAFSSVSGWGAGSSATISPTLPYPFPAYPLGGARMYSASTLVQSGVLFEVFSSSSAFTLYYSSPTAQDLTAAYAVPTINFSTPTSVSYPGPALAPGAFFFYCSATGAPHYVLSGTSQADGSLVGYRWTSLSAAPTALRFDVQVTDVLQDDTLVSRGPLVTKYYSSEGVPLFELPTGALRYVHEYDDGGTWYSYFTRAASAADGSNSSSGQMLFDVFRYPSAGLSSLAKQ